MDLILWRHAEAEPHAAEGRPAGYAADFGWSAFEGTEREFVTQQGRQIHREGDESAEGQKVKGRQRPRQPLPARQSKTADRRHGAGGAFRIPARIGGYQITAELQGFSTVTRTGIQLLVGQTASIPLQMSPSTIQETVTVTAEAPLSAPPSRHSRPPLQDPGPPQPAQRRDPRTSVHPQAEPKSRGLRRRRSRR